MAKLNLDSFKIPEADATPKHSPKPKPKRAVKKPVTNVSGKVSPYASDLRAKLRIKKQLSFGQLPSFIVDEMDNRALELGMNKREYLYHLLRNDGIEIPPYEQMDGRKL